MVGTSRYDFSGKALRVGRNFITGGVTETEWGARDGGNSFSQSGIIPNSVLKTAGMPVLICFFFCALFAFDMVTNKIHLIENSVDLIL